jgi:hypothetical protein
MTSTNVPAADQATNTTDVLHAALGFVRFKIPVLPLWGVSADDLCNCGADGCKHAGKHPNGQLAPKGVHDASTDPETVREWFSDPSANLGIATGHPLPTGGYLVVLDVDPSRGGADSLAALEAEHGALSRDATAETGGGGIHIYLAAATVLPQSQDQLGRGLELKSAGGYVVTPPSWHRSGGRYRWIGDAMARYGVAPDAPAWLEKGTQSTTDRKTVSDKPIQKLVGEALALGKGAHETALHVARRIRQQGIVREEAFDFIRAANQALREIDQATRELDDSEIQGLVKWTYENVAVAAPGRRFEIVRPDLARVRPFRWAWRHWLLMGMLNLLVGPEGAGKGTLIVYVIAKLSCGELEGDLYGKPTMTLILGDEDSFDHIWTPRLFAAGADLEFVRCVKSSDGGALSFPSEAGRLREIVNETGARILFFDQLLDNLDFAVNDWKSKEVRAAIAPLRALAADLDCAVICCLHTNKASGGSFRQSVSGSHAFNALSRSSLLVAQHPDGPEERRVVARGKGNYGKRPQSLEFTIEGRSPKIGGKTIQTAIAVDFKESPLTAEDLLAAHKPERISKASIARDYIRQELADGEWHDANPMIEHLGTLGIEDRAARKAREEVGAESRNKPEFQGGTEWRLQTGDSRGGDLISRFSRFGRNGKNNPPRKAESPANPANPADVARLSALVSAAAVGNPVTDARIDSKSGASAPPIHPKEVGQHA